MVNITGTNFRLDKVVKILTGIRIGIGHKGSPDNLLSKMRSKRRHAYRY